jgi:small conductance mechanosensitive channel
MFSLATTPTCDDQDWLCNTVLDTTGNQWLAKAADWLIAKPLALLLILVVALLARWVALRLIHRLITRTVGGTLAAPLSAALPTPLSNRVHNRMTDQQSRQAAAVAERRRQRAETLGSVLSSVASFVIFTVALVLGIAVFGVDIGPLVASAGLVGVALGFGAQNLVRDFLSGLFMFFEDQCGVGDKVIIGDTEGIVEAIALRITRVRGEDGTVWYIRNGEILKVGNVSQAGETPNLSEALSTPEDEQKVEEAETAQRQGG